MKITAQFDSLDEFLAFGGIDASGASNEDLAIALAQLGNKVEQIRSAQHKDGDDFIARIIQAVKIHADTIEADFKDSDDVKENYNVDLFLKAKNAFSVLYLKHADHKSVIDSWMRRVAGDIEIKPGLADHIYENYLRNARYVEEMLS